MQYVTPRPSMEKLHVSAVLVLLLGFEKQIQKNSGRLFSARNSGNVPIRCSLELLANLRIFNIYFVFPQKIWYMKNTARNMFKFNTIKYFTEAQTREPQINEWEIGPPIILFSRRNVITDRTYRSSDRLFRLVVFCYL